MTDDYEYWGLLAAGWDALRGDPAACPDRQFYRDVIKSAGEPALDVGCGTGRLLLEYAADGLDVDGVDNSPEMLAICREKADQSGLAVALYEQEMQALDLTRRYNTIFVPSSSFQLVTDLANVHRALNGFYRHLLPGGVLVMSFWHIFSEGSPEWGDWWQVAEVSDFVNGRDLRRWERSRYDAETQLRHTENRYELLGEGSVVFTEYHRRSPELRNYSVAQISTLVEEAGFVEVSAVAGQSEKPASEQDRFFHVFGWKAEE